MQRRLVKSMEDWSVSYNGTVRNSKQDIIEFNYGKDGLDPSYIEGMDGPVDFEHALLHCQATNPCNDEDSLEYDELVEAFQTLIKQDSYMSLGDKFRADLM